ncbi:MAG: hypothetical protein Q8P20_10245 [bacterium]|nr:hypothetical protein [bacterium]
MSDSEDGEDDQSDSANGRKNKHHTLPKSRIKALNREKQLKRRGAKKIDEAMHTAYHMIFINSFPWEAVKRLKEWAKQQRNGGSADQPPSFSGFTPKQTESFIKLFGCQPSEFLDNGHLNNAITVIKEIFYAPQDVFAEYVDAINVLKRKKSQ